MAWQCIASPPERSTRLGVSVAVGLLLASETVAPRAARPAAAAGPDDPGRQIVSRSAYVSAGPIVDGVAVGERLLLARGDGLDLLDARGRRVGRIGLPGVPAALAATGDRAVALDERHRLWPIALPSGEGSKEGTRVGAPIDVAALRNDQPDGRRMPFGYLDPVVAMADDFVYLVHRSRGTTRRELLVLHADGEGEAGLVATASLGATSPVMALQAHGDRLLGRAVHGHGADGYPRAWRPWQLAALPERDSGRQVASSIVVDIGRRQVPRPVTSSPRRLSRWELSPGGHVADAMLQGASLLLLQTPYTGEHSSLRRLRLLSDTRVEPGPGRVVRALPYEGLAMVVGGDAAWVLGRDAGGAERLDLWAMGHGAARGTPLPTPTPRPTRRGGGRATQRAPTTTSVPPAPRPPTDPVRPTAPLLLRPSTSLPGPPPTRLPGVRPSPPPVASPTLSRPYAPHVPRERVLMAGGDVLTLGHADGRLSVFDRRSGRLLRTQRHPGALLSVAADGDLAVVSAMEGTAGTALLVLDLRHEPPRVVGRLPVSPAPGIDEQRRRATMPVELEGDLAAVLVPGGTLLPSVDLLLVDLSRPEAPQLVARRHLPGAETGVSDLRLDRGWAYVSAFQKLFVVDVREPARPRGAGVLEVPANGAARLTVGPDMLLLSGRNGVLVVPQLAPGRLHYSHIQTHRDVVVAAGAQRLHLAGWEGVVSLPWGRVAGRPSYEMPVPIGGALPAWRDAVVADETLWLFGADALLGVDVDPAEPAVARTLQRFPATIADVAVAGRDLLVVAGAGGLHRLRVAPRPAAPWWLTDCSATRDPDVSLEAVFDAPRWRLLEERAVVARGERSADGLRERMTLGEGPHRLVLRADADTGVGPASAPLRILVRPELSFDPAGVRVTRGVGDGAMRSEAPRGPGGCGDPGVPAVGPLRGEAWPGWTIGAPPGVPLTVTVPVRVETDSEGRPPVVAVSVTLGGATVALARDGGGDGTAGGGAAGASSAAGAGAPAFSGVLPGWRHSDVEAESGDVIFTMAIEDAAGEVLRVPGRVRHWRVALPWVGAGR